MNFLAENWYLLVALAAVIFAVLTAVYAFSKKPRSEQLEAVGEWLLYAVIEAEKELGSGTGQLKLRKVYDMFLSKFGFLAKIISFEKFSELVDIALYKMENVLVNNDAIKTYVEGSESK